MTLDPLECTRLFRFGYSRGDDRVSGPSEAALRAYSNRSPR
jgi:hypothetical protein